MTYKKDEVTDREFISYKRMLQLSGSWQSTCWYEYEYINVHKLNNKMRLLNVSILYYIGLSNNDLF